MLVENQGYIHYRKGSVVMYALEDYVGEENLNAQIRRFAEAVKFQEPPYTTTKEFLSYLQQAVPARYDGLLDDLFRDITLYENRAQEATWHRREDGKYLVRLDVDAQKFHADGLGAETEVPMDAWVDVAVFGDETENGSPEGEVLAMEKRRVTGPGVIEMVVDEEPRRAGIDPYNKLIDRNPENNVVKVSRGDEAAAEPEQETVMGELPR
jgi:ABC-2 type transport system permease protein